MSLLQGSFRWLLSAAAHHTDVPDERLRRELDPFAQRWENVARADACPDKEHEEAGETDRQACYEL